MKCSVEHNKDAARRATADTASGLEINLNLACGVKVMPTKNLHQEVGLVSGIRGEIVEIINAEGKPSPMPPLYVVVKFDGYRGGGLAKPWG